MNKLKLFKANYSLWLLLFIIAELVVIYYKFLYRNKKPQWTKILLFVNSLIINDLSIRYALNSNKWVLVNKY
ncbi:MAG: hypothetical protein ACMG6E_09745 [Candidatus Roizmanbacteria bacterium]